MKLKCKKCGKSWNYNGKNKYYATCPDCKTSVLLNSVFRNIKENTNLDLLEESDDEDEFEDSDNIYQFVDMNKSCEFTCVFNKKFQSWIPLCIYNDDKLTS
jgi:DNA-directed RNA polymerase subunit RPC12/RpoP